MNVQRQVPHDYERAKTIARDADANVRRSLAAREDIRPEILYYLAEDRLPSVRRMLAEELQATALAPPEVSRKLAQDSEVEVAAPILEFTPLLTNADLLALIATGPGEALMTAISRRDGVSEPVSDAIVATESVPAIAALLANPSVQIREATLDRIVTKAPAIPSWHAPLAHRAALPSGIVRKLTGFLAVSLLKTLQSHGDLDPETAAMVAAAVHDRLQAEKTEGAAPVEDARQSAAREVRVLQEEGKLDAKALTAAVGERKHLFVTEALAALGHVPVKMVARILGAGNAAAVAALS